VANGRPPWIALALALSFGTYGLLKKQANVGAVASLAVETAVIGPVAAVYVVLLSLLGHGTFTGHGADHASLLATSGVITVVPLLLFGAAATRIPLITLGVLQYLAPTLQLAVGLGVRHEPFGPARLVGFLLVWVALAVFTTDLVRHHRRVSSVPAW
jgi:chloramphenicol-sensitive protein RarD